MLTRKRIIASAVGALALTAIAAGSAWADIKTHDDYYENDNSFKPNKHPYKVELGGHDGRTLVIQFTNSKNSNISPYNNDETGFINLIGVTANKKGYHGIRFAVKFNKSGNARLVIHFAKNFTSKFGGRIDLTYYVGTGGGNIQHSKLKFDIGGLCGNVSCA